MRAANFWRIHRPEPAPARRRKDVPAKATKSSQSAAGPIETSDLSGQSARAPMSRA